MLRFMISSYGMPFFRWPGDMGDSDEQRGRTWFYYWATRKVR